MKTEIKWLTAVIAGVLIFGSTYTIVSSSNEGNPLHWINGDMVENEGPQTEENGSNPVEPKQPPSKKVKEELTENHNYTYIQELFFHENIAIGHSEESILHAFGEPMDKGMYEGGRYFDYGDRTYFVNPEKEKINAIAVSSEFLNVEKWEPIEEQLNEHLRLEGFNEKDELWMEIYDWDAYDVMIERKAEGEKAHYIWITENSLFTPPEQ